MTTPTDSKLTIRPTSDFSTNGSASGTLVVYDEQGEPVWEDRGNWSNRAFQRKAAEDLGETLGITVERATSLIRAAVAEARKIGNSIEARRHEVGENEELPKLVVSGKRLSELTQECWDVLLHANEDRVRYFWWGGVAEIVEDAQGHVRPRLLNMDALGGHLDRLRKWVRRDTHGGEQVIFPPERVMRDMIAQSRPPLPALIGVADTPILSTRGDIADGYGYDPDTLLFIRVKTKVPPIAPKPYAGDIERARELLMEDMLIDFPWVSRSDKAHAVAMMLTVIVRPIIHGPTPLFMVEAPTEGSGKGLLADAASELLVGGPAMSVTEGHGDDEWRKRITSLLQVGAPLVRIDNVTRKVDSSSLASAITDQEWTDRLMGSNKLLTVPVRTTWMATGNNPEFSKEMLRRVVRVRIVPETERPWERTGFKHDPLLDWVRDNRGLLLWALLTLVRAWIVEGRPAGKYRLGSFESWASVVGGILDIAQIPGFLENRSEQHDAVQAEEAEWDDLVQEWANAYGSQQVDAGKLFDLAKEKDLLLHLRSGMGAQAARTKMGMRLSRMRDRIVAGYKVTYDGTHAGAAQYKLFMLQGGGTAKGHQGSPGSPIQVTLGDPGDPLPYLAARKSDFDEGSDSVSIEPCRKCGKDDFLRYSPRGELYCALCHPIPEDLE